MALPFPVPASLSPSFVMSRCTPADTEALADVYYKSFKLDPGNSHWWSPDRDCMMAWMKARIHRKMADPSVRYFKITDVGTGDLVAWSRWDIPENSTSFGDWAEEPRDALDVSQLVQSRDQAGAPATGSAPEASPAAVPSTDRAAPTLEPPEGADAALCHNFFSAIMDAAAKWHTKDMIGLSLLCTSPSYHRRGAAKALLQPVLDIADREGIKVYLEATPGGKPVYERLSFQPVDTLDFDLSVLTKDQEGLYRLSIMIRDPQPTAPK